MTLVDALQSAADSDRGIVFTDSGRLSYAELLERASRRAASLANRYPPDTPLILQIRPQQEFIETLWACILAGNIPVPLTPARGSEQLKKLRTVQDRLGCPVLADAVTAPRVSGDPLPERARELHTPTPVGRVLIQFSSGSTGDPKGIVLTHANVLANLHAIIERSRTTVEDRSLSWMPLTHDMGLIGFHFGPLVAGIEQVLMPTWQFLAHPEAWLSACCEHQISVTCSPSFGLRHAVKAAAASTRLRLLYLGAEPIHPEDASRFCEHAGIDPSVLYPVYGLAEGTVGVTLPEPGTGLVLLEGEVCVGTPLPCCELKIIDGELFVRGESVARHYVGGPAPEWVPTGDFGVERDGRYAITGRCQDRLFVAGQNVFLHDLDRLACEASGVDAAVHPEADGVRLHLKRVASQQAVDRAVAALEGEYGVEVVGVERRGRLPRTTSGKLQRHRLGEPRLSRALDAVERVIGKRLDPDQPFLEAGISSVQLAEIAQALEPELGRLSETDLFSWPTLRGLVERPRRAESLPAAMPDAPVHLIGLAVRASGCDGVEAFWAAVREGADRIRELPEARRADLGDVPVPLGGYLDRIDGFDPEAFGVSEAEAALWHPTHRLLLELVKEAFVDAGSPPGRVGVYVGHVGDFEGTDYRALIERLDPARLGLAITGNLSAFLAGRIAHLFDWTGPALVVDTACSASLSAVHLACEALRRGECDVAVVGSARVRVAPGEWPVQMGFESASGRARSFDASADGTVLGEGGGVVVLSRQGPGYARILGSALSQDGRSASLTAPHPLAQADAIRRAWQRAGVAGVDYVETHGAATPLSDPVEVAALDLVFAEHAAERGRCALGAAKASFGHLFEAAGILGLIKAVLVLRDGIAPPICHFSEPNPRIDFDASATFVPTEPTPLAGSTAGVTALGFSGTNVHVVLQSGDRPLGARVDWNRRRCWVTPPDRLEEEVRPLITSALLRFGGVHLEGEAWQRSWFDLGLDSVALVQLAQTLSRELQLDVPLRLLFAELDTPQRLADHASSAERTQAALVSENRIVAPSVRRYIQALTADLARQIPSTRQLLTVLELASNRTTAGFRPQFEGLIGPLHVAKGRGAWVSDVDGNDYVDLSGAFGVALFGHDPPFLRRAVAAALGEPLGPMTRRAADVAKKLCSLTGTERVAFYNSGTEAVMVAIRLARAVTGRAGVAQFRGSYHGTFDGVLAVADGVPAAPGTTEGAVADTLVLDYGEASALETVWKRADELAAVLVEPVQSRHPERQPRAFLQELRALCDARGIALIFDEVITGFRLGPRGAQGFYDVDADLVVYGKVLGGGLPIGAVAGKARFLDAVDGKNNAPRPVVAGTFCHHPLAMAAAEAVLDRMQEPFDVDTPAARLVERLDVVLAATPIRMARCGSLFRFRTEGDAELLFYELLRQGVYIWEGRNCFWSTAHGEREADLVVSGVERAVERLGTAGVFDSGRWLALNPAQQGTVEREQRYPGSGTISAFVAVEGPVAVDLDALVARHPALRVDRVTPEGVRIGSARPQRLEAADFSPFGSAGPQFRLVIEPGRLGWIAHRSVCDGWSLGLLLEEALSEPALAPAHDPGRVPLVGSPGGTEAWPAVIEVQEIAAESLRERCLALQIPLFGALAVAVSQLFPGPLCIPLAGQPRLGCERLVWHVLQHRHVSIDGVGSVTSDLLREVEGPADVLLNLDRTPRLVGSYLSPWPGFTTRRLVVNVTDAGGRLFVEWKTRAGLHEPVAEWKRAFRAALEAL